MSDGDVAARRLSSDAARADANTIAAHVERPYTEQSFLEVQDQAVKKAVIDNEVWTVMHLRKPPPEIDRSAESAPRPPKQVIARLADSYEKAGLKSVSLPQSPTQMANTFVDNVKMVILSSSPSVA